MRWSLVFLFVASLLAPAASGQSLAIFCEEDPPNQMMGPDGRLTGLGVEITEEIQKRTGNHDTIELVPWARGYDAILSVPGTVLFSMTRTPEREALFHWVGPILETTYAFYARADSGIKLKSLDEARKVRRIGVYNNDVRDTFLTQAGFTNLDRTSNNIQNFKKLMAGRIDLYASSPLAIEEEARAAGFKASGARLVFAFMQVQLYIALSRATPRETVEAWTEAFASLRKDGTFARIHRKYYPGRPLPARASSEF